MLAEGQEENEAQLVASRGGSKRQDGASEEFDSRQQSSAKQGHLVDDIEDDEGLDGVGGIEADGLEGEEEVSINLEDAIATAEEINNNGLNGHLAGMQQQIIDGFEGDEEDEIANEVAGILTDGHQAEMRK